MSEDGTIIDRSQTPPVKLNKRGKPVKIGKRPGMYLTDTDTARVLSMIVNGKSQSEIQRETGVDDTALTRLRDKYTPFFKELANLKEIEQLRKDFIAANEYKALKLLNEKLDHESTRARDAAFAFKVLHESGRLERGLSTKNTSVAHSYNRVDLSKK